ncbi:MAG: hypothetical protein ABH870_05040 [bacterium]
MQAVLTPALRFEIKELIDERIREKHVRQEDFTELKDIVKEIAKEQREIANTQKRTELIVKELVNVQKETQKEIKELAMTIKDTREELRETKEELKGTKEEMKGTKEEMKGTMEELKDKLKGTNDKFSIELNYTRRDLGGITSTLGFMLENEAYRILPKMLKDRYGIEIKERFLRRSIKSFGIKEEGEVNIFSHGVQQDTGTKVVIIGEAKSQLGKDDIDALLSTVARLQTIDKDQSRFLLMVTHYTKETVVEYAKEKGVEIIQSFEW